MHRLKLFSWENLILLLLAAAGLLTFILLNDQVFPTASIDFKLSKSQVGQIGEDYLAKLGIDTAGYTRTIIFGSDDDASVYLSSQLGIQKTNDIIKSTEIPIWRWELRWFIPGERTEYQMFITPQGEVVAFKTVLPEDAAGGDVGRERALLAAQDFLTGNPRFSSGDWQLVEDSSKTLPNRTDYYFTWEDKSTTYGEEGHLRMSLVVAGEQVSTAQLLFKAPEKFLDQYKHTKSWGSFLGMFSVLGTVILVIGGIIILLKRIRTHTLPIKYALVVGLAVACAVFLYMLNNFPTSLMNYETSQAYATFLFQHIFYALMGGLLYGLVVFVVATSGQTLGLKFFPDSLNTTESFRRREVFGRPLAMASLRGYFVAFIGLGYQTLFYLLGTRYFGVWFPAGNEYSDVYGTLVPFIAPLSVGVLAAVSEEYMFRLFGVSWFKSIFRNTFLAALLASMIWALGHSTYAIYPVYTRGIELTIDGLITCFFFLRYDLMTVIIAHYAIDAIFVGIPMLRSGNTYFLVSGVVVMALAALPLLSLLFLRRKTRAVPAVIIPHISDSTLRLWTRRLLAALAIFSGKLPAKQGKELVSRVSDSFLSEDFGNAGRDISRLTAQTAQYIEELGGAPGKVTELSENRSVIVTRPKAERFAVVTAYLSGIIVSGYQLSAEKVSDRELKIIINKKK
jgi:hypothetical protein